MHAVKRERKYRLSIIYSVKNDGLLTFIRVEIHCPMNELITTNVQLFCHSRLCGNDADVSLVLLLPAEL
jgi:hypothetical protein